jgi:subtilisin
VAGGAAALDNRIGVVGIAPGARIWNVRIFAPDGSLSLESLLCGLDYVRANARDLDVGIMSFGQEGTPDGPCGRKLQLANGPRPRAARPARQG